MLAQEPGARLGGRPHLSGPRQRFVTIVEWHSRAWDWRRYG